MASDSRIDSLPATSDNDGPPNLMTLPPEIRLEILRYCLRTERNRVASWTVDHMSNEDFSSMFAHLPATEDMPLTMSAPEDIRYQLHPAILTVCTMLLNEGRTVLYAENRWIAIEGTADSPIGFRLKLSGFNTRWRLSSPIHKALLEAPNSLMQSGGDAASLKPWLSFDLAKNEGGDRETQLVSLSEVDLVIQAIWILHSIQGGSHGKPASRLMIHNQVASLDEGASTLLIRRILPWLPDRVSEVCFDVTIYSKSFQHFHEDLATPISSDTASVIVKELSNFSTMETTKYQVSCMRAISRYLDDLGLTQHLGDSMLPVLNNLVVHMANETTSGHLRNHILLRPCILALAWKIAFLESRFFALPDHDDNGALARNRHQFQSAL